MSSDSVLTPFDDDLPWAPIEHVDSAPANYTSGNNDDDDDEDEDEDGIKKRNCEEKKVDRNEDEHAIVCPSEGCNAQLDEDPSELLKGLLAGRPRLRNYEEDHMYEFALIDWEEQVCQRINHEMTLASNVEIGWPVTLDYADLMSRVYALRPTLVAIIESGKNAFIFQQILEKTSEDRSPEVMLDLRKLNRATLGDDYSAELCDQTKAG